MRPAAQERPITHSGRFGKRFVAAHSCEGSGGIAPRFPCTRRRHSVVNQRARLSLRRALTSTAPAVLWLGYADHGNSCVILVRDEGQRVIQGHGHFIRLVADRHSRHDGIARRVDYRHRVLDEIGRKDKSPIRGYPDAMNMRVARVDYSDRTEILQIDDPDAPGAPGNNRLTVKPATDEKQKASARTCHSSRQVGQRLFNYAYLLLIGGSLFPSKSYIRHSFGQVS